MYLVLVSFSSHATEVGVNRVDVHAFMTCFSFSGEDGKAAAPSPFPGNYRSIMLCHEFGSEWHLQIWLSTNSVKHHTTQRRSHTN